jgi:hypothetical protein
MTNPTEIQESPVCDQNLQTQNKMRKEGRKGGRKDARRAALMTRSLRDGWQNQPGRLQTYREGILVL